MEQPQRKITASIAGLVIVGSLLSLWWMFRPTPVKIDRAPIIAAYTSLGVGLADETAKAIQDHGRIVLVADRAHEPNPQVPDDCWETFHRELQKHGKISIVATEILPPDPNEGPPPSCSRAALQGLLQRHAQADAIVFFRDLPEWPRMEELMPRVTAKIIAVDNFGKSLKLHYSGYLSSGNLAVLIAPRGGDAKSAGEPQTPRAWFDRFFTVYLPKDADTLPSDEFRPVPGP